jgi:hypothetical protein
MMEIVLGVLSQIVSGQVAGGPGFVKWMAKQVVFRDARFKLGEKLSCSHRILSAKGVTAKYTDGSRCGQVIGITGGLKLLE